MSSKSDRGTKRPKISQARDPDGEPESKECGCRQQKFTDGTKDSFPCIPHALQTAATSMQEAGNALGYVGHTLAQADAAGRAMKALNDEVDEGIESGEITEGD